jgi:hypothetical protein
MVDIFTPTKRRMKLVLNSNRLHCIHTEVILKFLISDENSWFVILPPFENNNGTLTPRIIKGFQKIKHGDLIRLGTLFVSL